MTVPPLCLSGLTATLGLAALGVPGSAPLLFVSVALVALSLAHAQKSRQGEVRECPLRVHAEALAEPVRPSVHPCVPSRAP